MRRNAYLTGTREQTKVVVEHLSHLLAYLRMMYLSYQTSHWQAKGPTYYGNHLLFQRLYESVQGEIDALAEKIVGYVGPAGVELAGQTTLIRLLSEELAMIPDLHLRGLESETKAQHHIQRAYEAIKASGMMTLGLDDWLMATANAHESNVYLLQQVLDNTPTPKVASGEVPPPRGYRLLRHDTQGNPVFIKGDEGKVGTQLIAKWGLGWGLWVWQSTGWLRLDDSSPIHRTPQAVADVFTGVKVAAAVRARVNHKVPTAEAYFFDNPERREVREFAHSKAISNVPAIAVSSGKEEGLMRPALREERWRARIAPPTPTDIREKPGAKEFSTLNRYLVETEHPTDAAVPQGHGDVPKHRRIDPTNDDIILADGTVIDPSNDDYDDDGHGNRLASWTFAFRG